LGGEGDSGAFCCAPIGYHGIKKKNMTQGFRYGNALACCGLYLNWALMRWNVGSYSSKAHGFRLYLQLRGLTQEYEPTIVGAGSPGIKRILPTTMDHLKGGIRYNLE